MPHFSPQSDHLLVSLENKVACLTLNRPQTRNALTDEMRTELVRAISWAKDCPDVGALLITGAGHGFCSGADLRSGSAANGPGVSMDSRFKTLVARHKAIAYGLTTFPKPTLAAISGPAVGAGLSIAMSCDIRLAADGTFLMAGYPQRGLSGDYGISWLLTRLIGGSWARYYLLTGSRMPASRALELGAVNEVVAFNDLQSRAMQLAEQLANGPAVAQGYLKQNLDEALSIDHASAIEREADRLLKCNSTEDAKEAARAFTEKRDARFIGR